ncbi:MAG: hypothetical protein WCO26_04325 [Deltaproteobacteria bacterium]
MMKSDRGIFSTLIITGPFDWTICLGSIGSRNGRLFSDTALLYAGGFRISGGSVFSFASSVPVAGVFFNVKAGFWRDVSFSDVSFSDVSFSKVAGLCACLMVEQPKLIRNIERNRHQARRNFMFFYYPSLGTGGAPILPLNL